MIETHKRQVEWWKSKLGLSDYGVAWVAFFKGIIFGMLLYHFLITN